MNHNVSIQVQKQWTQTLDMLQQDIICLKNSLAEVVKNARDKDLLEKMEYFQSSFINKDAVIALLRHEVIALAETESMDGQRLKDDINRMRQEIERLKHEFGAYLHHAIAS